MLPHRNCVITTSLGLLTGCAAVAYGQDTPAVPTELVTVADIIRAGGLPMVLAYIGYVLGKGLPQIQVAVTLDEESKTILQTIADKLHD